MQYLEALYRRARGQPIPPEKLALIKIKKREAKKEVRFLSPTDS